jgi:cbb3-type cytochrome oxidase subunit 3
MIFLLLLLIFLIWIAYRRAEIENERATLCSTDV